MIIQEEINKILDRLERIDHKEYIAFEFADSATFDEIQEVLCPKVLIMKPKSQITISDNVNLVLPDNCSYERIGDTYVYEMPEE